MLSRRGLITGLVSFVAAPAIVRAASLMPVKALKVEQVFEWREMSFAIEVDNSAEREVVDLLQARMDDAVAEMVRWNDQRMFTVMAGAPDQQGGLQEFLKCTNR